MELSQWVSMTDNTNFGKSIWQEFEFNGAQGMGARKVVLKHQPNPEFVAPGGCFQITGGHAKEDIWGDKWFLGVVRALVGNSSKMFAMVEMLELVRNV